MDAPNPSSLWAAVFVDELARAGLRAACIAPGSRSTPLTVAFARHPNITVYSLLDERGAAYFALGLALATGQPAALVCTSGTATANFFPAIVEANVAHVPLLVLTTDRPPELRHSGANQTIDQLNLFGEHARWFVDVALPETAPAAVTLRSLRALAGRALAATRGFPPGPVHLNFPFRKPLEPIPGDSPLVPPVEPRPNGAPFAAFSRGQLAPSALQIDDLCSAIQSSRRGVIVCGPRCPGGDFPAAVTELARAGGLPILPDALSGVRFGPHTTQAEGLLLAGYETFLQREVVSRWPAPDLILQFGALPISRWLGEWLGGSAGARRMQISASGVWQDDSHTTSDFIWADPATLCQAVSGRLAGQSSAQETGWLARLRAAEAQTWQVIDQTADFFEGRLLADVVELLPSPAALFVASSLPVRHLDQFARPAPTELRLFANRGASGIDGTIASALGAAAGSGLPLTLVIGDLAFYHDLNSLLALRRCGLKATIVLINNNGGGIFHRLPIARVEPPFTELFVTPHGLEFAAAAQLFGLDYRAVTNPADFRRVFAAAVAAPESMLIEVKTSAQQHESVRREINGRVAQALRESA
ncbi:MAG: 2-succinyl-5-enolpyruvyl-6-hydroxy-3-cyclohexene-1-carboxylate synthase [Anaerolineae bacterium]|nr:2-succinyl-5-enolpyruvyl-6-hydroxy-3-cyclohexene-1-carboxylate synthase [Anaerolineae bacterium]